MNKILIFLGVALLVNCPGRAQTLNWGNLQKNQQHIFSVYGGVEQGVIFGAGFGYRLKSKLPVLLHAEYSFPAGKKLADDFKSKLGVQLGLYQSGYFRVSARLDAVFRRYENDFARLLNFGSDLSAVAGYYRSGWFIAGESGFDKAIVTHFKHSGRYRDIYPGVKDGWYEPSTGGNFYYGLQTGYSFKSADIFLKAGKMVSQDFRTAPLVPFYMQAGLTWKLHH